MKIIGVVGGSGAGKSQFCAALEKAGIPSLNTDITAREAVQKGSPCLAELVGVFGERILCPDGSLARKALANLAFPDRNLHEKLNEITHRYICVMVKQWLYETQKKGYAAAIVDAPLLFESGLDAICDVKVCVIAPEKDRIKRICQRDGIDEVTAEKRIFSQKSDEELIRLCDITVVNDKGIAALEKKAAMFAKDVISQGY